VVTAICRWSNANGSPRCASEANGVREVARRGKRTPSTISRELHRNLAAHDDGVYDADLAHSRARPRRLRPRRGRLVDDAELRAVVQARLELDAIGTLVDRTSRYVRLIHLPDGRRAHHLQVGLVGTMCDVPPRRGAR